MFPNPANHLAIEDPTSGFDGYSMYCKSCLNTVVGLTRPQVPLLTWMVAMAGHECTTELLTEDDWKLLSRVLEQSIEQGQSPGF